eukprot:EG_transcript_10926
MPASLWDTSSSSRAPLLLVVAGVVGCLLVAATPTFLAAGSASVRPTPTVARTAGRLVLPPQTSPPGSAATLNLRPGTVRGGGPAASDPEVSRGPGLLSGPMAVVGCALLAAVAWGRGSLRQRQVELQSLALLASTGTTVPKTGHHTAEEELVREAVAHFFEDPDRVVVTPTTGGVNNVVQYLTTPDGDRYILRIYNNGNKSEKVVWEHAILRQVNQQPLSFETPRALPAKDGRSHVLLSSGAECCVFHVIPGTLAKTTSPFEVGRATGELCTAMGNVKVDMKGPIAPYWDVFAAHHHIGGRKELFYAEVAANPAFEACREAMDYLVGQIRLMEAKLEQFHALDLPQQVVHGDLHYDNVMVVDDTVSGFLDFEFCAYDWRAMELAVALSKYVGEAEPLPLIEEFVEGYCQFGRLTPDEIAIIPDLISLRIFSNVIYFTSRAMAQEDGIESLTSRAPSYAKRVRWINDNRDAIVSAIKSRMPVA